MAAVAVVVAVVEQSKYIVVQNKGRQKVGVDGDNGCFFFCCCLMINPSIFLQNWGRLG